MQNPLLQLFKEQLENECSTLVDRNSLPDRGRGLIWWYFERLLGFSDTDIEGVVCDGPNDLAIDAIWIDDAEEEEVVHFYQFKHPFDAEKVIPGGDVDKVISGLELILSRRHEGVSNPNLRARIEELYRHAPTGYRLHFVSSGWGLGYESEVKLNAFVERLRAPSADFFRWQAEDLERIHDQFYQRNLPAVSTPIVFALDNMPYMARSADADAYFFHVSGKELAELYHRHQEGLLQRNIRVWQGTTATNRSIEVTCTGPESGNFLHYNNGVSFLCESASWDQFQKKLTLQKAQVVNGGQTIRTLHRAHASGNLKPNVLVPARVITSQGNKEFASEVAINQNNQNQMGTGFLRSNDPGVVQLGHSLESLGWYLERRDGELDAASDAERAAIATRIGRAGVPLDRWTIKLKEGTQAYVATFFGQPELAKKNMKKMFLSSTDGGAFDKIFSADLTAEKVIVAHQIKQVVDEFVRTFMAQKRRKDRVEDWEGEYRALLGDSIVNEFLGEIDQVVPQSAVFLCGTVFQDLTKLRGMPYGGIPNDLQESGKDLIQTHLFYILEYAKKNPQQKNKSWPSLLKSMTFFTNVMAYLGGIRKGATNARS
jgi:hypothetical protein